MGADSTLRPQPTNYDLPRAPRNRCRWARKNRISCSRWLWPGVACYRHGTTFKFTEVVAKTLRYAGARLGWTVGC